MKPTDRNYWETTAPMANAYYQHSWNEIVFPTVIMQPPFLNEKLPEYIKYGAFGSLAEHGLIHGFDHDGLHYNENGILGN
jgi:predicted metalloendopeptidase